MIVKINPKRINAKIISHAVTFLKDHKLIVFPTETLYGLGANALDEKALRKLLMVKGRPHKKGFVILIGRKDDVYHFTRAVPLIAKKLMRAFWPGALTLVMYKNEKLPSLLTGGKDTIAVRLDKHPIARRIAQNAGFPIAAPSANMTGSSAPKTITEPYHFFNINPQIALYIDAGKSPIGKPSTIIDVTTQIPRIIRLGAITKKQLKKVVPDII